MPDESMPQSTQPLERRLATILCADIAGYSQIMGANEERTVRVFRGHREIFESLVNTHRGRIFNTAGDALLAEFNSAVEAVRCATEIQAALRTRNDHLAPEERMQFRIGINLGDVIIQGGDLLGDGVNVAARIQTATAPGGICISGSVHDQIQNKLSLEFKPLGEQTFKNITKPIRTYTICEGAAVTKPARLTGWLPVVLVAIAAVALAGTGYWGYRQYAAHRAEQLRADAKSVAQQPVQKQATQPPAQKQAPEQAQRASQDAQRDAQLQAQKKAVEEELRRAQEERKRLAQERKQLEAGSRSEQASHEQAMADAERHAQEKIAQLKQERKRIEAEKLAAETAGKQAEKQAAETARKQAEKQAAETVRKQAEKQAAEAARKQGKEVPLPAPAAAKDAAQPAVTNDGSYSGKLCRQEPKKDPVCWAVPLTVRNGNAEGSWMTRSTQKTARVRGTINARGSVQLNLATFALNGAPVKAMLHGRIADGAITVSGRFKSGETISGTWNLAR